MNYIDERLIYTVDSNEIIEYYKSLNNIEKERYLKLYSIYSNFLIQFFIKRYNLKEYDNMLINHSTSFPIVYMDKMDIYQYTASKWLKYIYIRNNIHIERLSKNEIEYLEKQLSNRNYKLDKETEEFIENTFLNIIIEKNNNQIINFGPDNLKFFKPANSIIIGIRYDNLLSKDNESDKEWLIKERDRNKFIFAVKTILEYELKNKITLPVSVIQYNDFSTIKK